VKWPWTPKPDSGYRPFTTAFDQVVTGDTLTHALTPIEHAEWTSRITHYKAFAAPHTTRAATSSLATLDQILSTPGFQPDDCAVSILTDHSGSLRGTRALVACFLMETLGDLLSRTGVAYELLAFTTSTWKGGESRKLWLNMSRPRKPGRLNDLLHIIYRDAQDSSPGAPHNVYHVLRPSLLKENIDGEAVLWAAERLQQMGRPKRLIIVISDGAPVDDSTLNENPPDTLINHLNSVVADLNTQPDVAIAGIGIDHDTVPFYGTAITVKTLDQVCTDVPPFLAAQLTGPSS